MTSLRSLVSLLSLVSIGSIVSVSGLTPAFAAEKSPRSTRSYSSYSQANRASQTHRADDAGEAIRSRGHFEASHAVSERRGLVLGYTYGFHAYVEPGLMHEHGALHGMNASYELLALDDVLMMRVSGEVIAGQIKYDGALTDADNRSRPYSTVSDELIYSARGIVGFPRSFGAGMRVVPFAGFGLRNLNDRLQGVGAYEREIRYYFLPIGLEARVFSGKRFSTTLLGEYDYFLGGTVRSRLTQVGWGRDIENEQAQGQGSRFAIDFSARLNGRFEVHVAPYWQFWKIDDSDSVVMDRRYWHEPANETSQTGVNISIGL